MSDEAAKEFELAFEEPDDGDTNEPESPDQGEAPQAEPEKAEAAPEPDKPEDKPSQEPEPDGEKAAADQKAEEDKDQPDDGDDPAQEPPVDWEQKFKSYDGRMRRREEEWEREKAEMLAKIEEAKQAKAPAADTEGKKPAAHSSGFDREAFKDEYGEDLLNAFQTMAREEATKLVEESASSIQQKLDPVIHDVNEVAQDKWYAAVVGEHEDFDEYFPGAEKNADLLDWIDSQPPVLARSYREVYKSGTARDTIDMLSRYKTETNLNQKPPEVDDGQDPGAAETKAKRKADAEKQARAAEAVKGKRGQTPKGRASADDFDGAWEEAVAAEGN
jgi:hypothetical protein